ncbi:hypothetical protein HDU67_003120, partial [Dinochytrium kinnereticum]
MEVDDAGPSTTHAFGAPTTCPEIQASEDTACGSNVSEVSIATGQARKRSRSQMISARTDAGYDLSCRQVLGTRNTKAEKEVALAPVPKELFKEIGCWSSIQARHKALQQKKEQESR